jgi:hypothetical protein
VNKATPERSNGSPVEIKREEKGNTLLEENQENIKKYALI